MALYNCPECNRQVSDKAERCPNCGLGISEILPTESKKCPVCKKEMLEQSKYCPDCGVDTQQVINSQRNQNQQSQNQSEQATPLPQSSQESVAPILPNVPMQVQKPKFLIPILIVGAIVILGIIGAIVGIQANNTRVEQERIAEEQRIEEERIAEEQAERERLETERIAEEKRLSTMYTLYPYLPDFGVFADVAITPLDGIYDSFVYNLDSFDNSRIEEYAKLLQERYQFVYFDSLENDGNTFRVYKNENGLVSIGVIDGYFAVVVDD